jgi:LmbE family N-acetylglucosaminyl deacetylase
LHKGKSVKIVLLTNGDADLDLWERISESESPQNQMIEHARLRQKETISAMNFLGLNKIDILFLGYPDNCLHEIFSSEDYSETKPFKSQYTDLSYTAYENSYSKNLPYCKKNICKDLTAILKDHKPKEIFVTHPSDGHKDHSATGKMIVEIVKKFESPVRIYGYYVSNSSKISSLKGSHRMFYKSTGKLKEFPLNPEIRDIKDSCLNKYKTQEKLINPIRIHFLKNESFWKLN